MSEEKKWTAGLIEMAALTGKKIINKLFRPSGPQFTHL